MEKFGGKNAMKRKHFDKCFYNPNMTEELREILIATEIKRRSNVSKARKEKGVSFPVNITTLR